MRINCKIGEENTTQLLKIMRSLKLFLTSLTFYFNFFCFTQKQIILTKNLSDVSLNNSVILFGEQHLGKQRRAIHEEWFQLSENNKIDTIFIEQPYSVYLNAKIKYGMKYLDMKPFSECSKKVLIPVDIEDDFEETVFAISSVLNKNGLKGSTFDLENQLFYSEYRKNKRLNSDKFLVFISHLEKEVLPDLKQYQLEFGKLLEMINKTYMIYSPDELSQAFFTKERDSLMAEQIEEYVINHNVKRWAGLFGAFHVSHPNDMMYDSKYKLYKNMYSELVENEIVFKNIQLPQRIIYKSLSEILKPNSINSAEFIDKYFHLYSKLNKHTIILDMQDDVLFCVTKK